MNRENKNFKSGFVTIVGRPNVGKSTIMNAMIGEKISIVSSRPQTTRNKILGVFTDENKQIVFVDTPGIHDPRSKLGEIMMNTVHDAMTGMDCVMVLLDSSHITDKDKTIITDIKEKKVPKILVLNKIDLVDPQTVLLITAQFAAAGYDEIIPVSAVTGDGLNELQNAIANYLPEGPHYFPDDMITDQPERLLCAEIIREKALLNLRDEVPHGIGIEIMGMTRENTSCMEINAVIYCERDAHKPIIIGKQGSMLRKIGTDARKDIEALLGEHVNLKLWVKVKNDWRNNKSELKNLGYE